MSIAEFHGPQSVPDDDYDRGESGARVPPQDEHAEQSVLGAMLLSKDAIADVVEVIRGVDFYRPAHELIFDTVLDLYGRGEPADAITVSAELTRAGELARAGGAPYLHTLVAGVPVAANAGYYAGIVREKGILRRLVGAGTKIVQIGYAAEGQVDDVVDQAQAEVYGVTDKRASEDYAPLADIMELTIDELEAIGNRDGAMAGVPTGFAELDELTNGLHAGQMVIVAARPAMGKSTIGLDVARAASIKNGLASCIFSLEMSRTEITMRLLSAEARIPLNHMRNGKMSDDDWNKLVRKMGEVSEAPLFIDDSPNLTMMEIRAKARRLKQRHDLRLIVIDYLQLMTSGKKVESRQLEVSEFSRQIKLLAKELEIPVIAISQLNRGSEQRTSKRPLLSDLRESGCMTADTTLLRADTGAPITLGALMSEGYDGVLVWSFDEDRRLVAAPVTNVFPSGRKQVYRLRLASGREVKATANHPFLGFQGWQRLDSLEVGSRIAIPRRTPEPVTPGLGWSEHRLGLLAHLIGDGCVLRSQPVHYASEDEESLSFVEAAAGEFGITPRRLAQKGWWHVYLPSPYRCTHGRFNPLRQWFRDLGIDSLRSHEKRIPQALHSASIAELAIFLRHLWANDGSVSVPKPGSRAGRLYYATSSRQLADGVARLLSRFGIVARIREAHKKGYRTSYHVVVADDPSMRKFCREIGVHGRRGLAAQQLLKVLEDRATNTNVDALPQQTWALVESERRRAGLTERQLQAAIGTHYYDSTLYKRGASRERLLRIADALDSDALRACATDDVFWDRILEIEPLGVEPVFDATVKGTHNFIADGIAAHNSLEQDSDMVLLLHREDVYERESTRPGEADLIVAKHRNGPIADLVLAFQGHYSRFVDMAQG
ncbi:MAG: replicative DNA helicase [Nocardioidaceae bacterium]